MLAVAYDSAKEGRLLLDNTCFTIMWVFLREAYAKADIVLKPSSERLGFHKFTLGQSQGNFGGSWLRYP